MQDTAETLEARVTRLVLEYAQAPKLPTARPLPAGLNLRTDLEIESLSLVSLAIRLGEEFEVDLVDEGMDLSNLMTVGDVVKLGRAILQRHGR